MSNYFEITIQKIETYRNKLEKLIFQHMRQLLFLKKKLYHKLSGINLEAQDIKFSDLINKYETVFCFENCSDLL